MTKRTLALLTIEYHNKDLLVLSTVLSNFIPLCLSHLYSVCSRSILLCSLATCFSVLSCCFALAQLSYIAPTPCFANFVVSPPLQSNPPSMAASSRNRIPAPTTQQNQRQRAAISSTTSTPTSVGEVNGRVDQLALVQQALQDGATPTMIAGFAMIIAQMQAQAAHSKVLLTITSSIGPLERSANFRDGALHGYDLTHNLIDPRSHMIYGEPTRPPMDQERLFRLSPPTIQPPFQAPHSPPPNRRLWLLLRRYNPQHSTAPCP